VRRERGEINGGEKTTRKNYRSEKYILKK
jgi:hypothetical protein